MTFSVVLGAASGYLSVGLAGGVLLTALWVGGGSIQGLGWWGPGSLRGRLVYGRGCRGGVGGGEKRWRSETIR